MKAAFLVVIAVLTLVAAEALFGLLFWMRDPANPIAFRATTEDAPYLYYLPAPGHDGRNPDGLQTAAERRKPEGVFRVGLVGGSVAANLGRRRDASGRLVLEQALREAAASDRIELVNAGVPGYVVEQDFLMVQLVLQHYAPDMIIGVDGYNDLFAFHITRFEETRGISYPPQNWRNFRVIEDLKEEQTFLARFKPLLRNTVRAVDMLMVRLRQPHYLDYSGTSPEQLEARGREYLQIVDDLRDFSASKGIPYYAFLQPFEDYHPAVPGRARGDLVPALAELYAIYDEGYRSRDYGVSLTELFDVGEDVYTDGVHLTLEGHRRMAEAVARALREPLRRRLAARRPSRGG